MADIAIFGNGSPVDYKINIVSLNLNLYRTRNEEIVKN